MRVSIEDIAETTGVSYAAVFRALVVTAITAPCVNECWRFKRPSLLPHRGEGRAGRARVVGFQNNITINYIGRLLL
jgi:hypothetical protein